ncbi:hypothetical protein EU545_04060 [Candidatus Thorarchaeota archaeon]|nr:MAG: hypothetical protein EU545_04060 [Candidatus Thorarchaeota archaeon]
MWRQLEDFTVRCNIPISQGKISADDQSSLIPLEPGYDITTGADVFLQDFAQPAETQFHGRYGTKPLEKDDRQDIIEQFWSAICQDDDATATKMLRRARGLHLDIARTLLQDRGTPRRLQANQLLQGLSENTSQQRCEIGDSLVWDDSLLDILHEQVIVPLTTAVSKARSNEELSLHSLRRETGSFYTPPAIARYISGQTLSYWLQHRTGFPLTGHELDTLDRTMKRQVLQALKNVRIVDPAVGAGIFLVEAANWLLSLRQALDDTQSVSHIKWDIVNRNLYGVDLLHDSVAASRLRLVLWASSNERPLRKARTDKLRRSIRQGNSIVGTTPNSNGNCEDIRTPARGFDWAHNFSQVFKDGGFDIVLGNPPYGNILSDSEKEAIDANFRWNITGGRAGTWNAASLFLVRARELLNPSGHLGMLLPNSMLRVGQFQKTRDFMLQELDIREIRDEASPIDDITLELISLIAGVPRCRNNRTVLIRSRREGIERENTIPIESLHESDIFVLYHDDILELVRRRGRTQLLSASRGRDIPSSHVRNEPDDVFSVPYATSGRSIRRYCFDNSYLKYTDQWFKDDAVLTESYEHVFLAATKNLPYPRVILKPKGVIHGGGIVKIDIHDPILSPAAVGMLLNSSMVRYLSIRYLTNYSELTTCLNTGIMDELPVVLPECQDVCALIFEELQRRYLQGKTVDSLTKQLDALADALVYEAYLLDEACLANVASDILEREGPLRNRQKTAIEIVRETSMLVSGIMESEPVRKIGTSPRMS